MDGIWLLVAGALIAGVPAVAVAFITNRSADNRTKVQLDRESRQQERERIRIIRSGPIQDLAELIKATSVFMGRTITPTSVRGGRMDFDPMHRVMEASFTSTSSMAAIGEQDVAEETSSLAYLLAPFLGELDVEQREQLVDENTPKIGVALESIKRHQMRLMEALEQIDERPEYEETTPSGKRGKSNIDLFLMMVEGIVFVITAAFLILGVIGILSTGRDVGQLTSDNRYLVISMGTFLIFLMAARWVVQWWFVRD
ncbi:MAG: hypothetical protein IIA92_03920 [Chloroflexi bacterium]|nr:hypothetical protein [Chloroflexota bacterium]